MPGGLLQLKSTGNENQYLNGKPEINFFKNVYMRHTNFVTNIIEVKSNYNEQLSFSDTTKLRIKIPRNGDLINHMFLKLDLPDIYSRYSDNEGFKFVDNIGSIIVKSAKLMFEDNIIEDLTGEYIHIHNNMYNPPEKRDIINKLSENSPELYNPIGYVDNEYRETSTIELVTLTNTQWLSKNYLNKPTIYGTTLYIPLPFWFTRNNGLSLPLIAMKYHTVYLDLELRPLKELITIVKKESISGFTDRFYDKAPIPSDNFDINTFLGGKSWNLNVRLDIDYVFLDNTERNQLVEGNNVYLIEQVQYRSAIDISGKKYIEMQLYHPVKEIFIFARKNNVSGTNQWTNFTNLDYENQKYKNYQTYYLEQATKFESLSHYTSGTDKYTMNDIQLLSEIWNKRPHSEIPSINRNNHTFYNEKIIENMTIFYNGNQRLENKPSNFFTHKQHFMHHNNDNITNLFKYSFAQNPEIFQPTGICNFSEIHKVGFDIQMKQPGIYNENYSYDLYFYFINYNVLDIRHGMGGLVYGNN